MSSALPHLVRLTCGRLLPGAAALAACRTGLCLVSASRVVQLMLRWVALHFAMFRWQSSLMLLVLLYCVAVYASGADYGDLPPSSNQS